MLNIIETRFCVPFLHTYTYFRLYLYMRMLGVNIYDISRLNVYPATIDTGSSRPIKAYIGLIDII